ncbi:hypothetical protein [Dysosmobacter sp.]|uniref:hypothetical protein n=1 Tax=Dysosmobacter sp. TaxID=2591382 RepID=UPI00262C0A0B|nr:hypothetical protein [Dysosmobacter sp.]
MRTPYQEAFDHVTASERLKDEVLDMTKREKQDLCRRIPKFILIAAVIVLLLAGTALAVNMPHLQDWFRQYWVEATGEDVMNAQQEEVMNSVTQSVDATSNMEKELEGISSEATSPNNIPDQAAANKDAPDTTQSPSAGQTPATSHEPTITVSLDSVAAGEDTLWMLVHVTGNYETGKRYSFGRGELLGAPEKEFSELGITVSRGVVAEQCEILTDGSLQILLRYQCLNSSADLTQGGTYQLQLEDLMMERDLVKAGQWNLSFSLDETTTSVPVVLEHITLPVEGLDNQDTVEFEEIRITSTGVKLVCQPQFSGYRLWADVALILADGSEISGSRGHSNWTGDADKSNWFTAYNWNLPVAVEQAIALRFGETVITFPQK